MKQFRCGDVVPGCGRSFSGSSEQIMTDVAEHARTAHGLSVLPEGLVAAVRANIVPVG